MDLSPALRQAIEEYVGTVIGSIPSGLRFDNISGIVDGYRFMRDVVEDNLERILRDAGIDPDDFRRWLGEGDYRSLVDEIVSLAMRNYDFYVVRELRDLRPEDIAMCWRMGNEFGCKLKDDFTMMVYEIMEESVLETIISMSEDIRQLMENYYYDVGLREAG